jgi:hypothetical protein
LTKAEENLEKSAEEPKTVIAEEQPKTETIEVLQSATTSNMIKISESAEYKVYFKMLKFGVNSQAVKNKMKSEGFDGQLLDNPDLMIEKTPADYETVEE